MLDKILYSNENEQITVLEKTCTKPHGQNVELYIYGMVPLIGSTKRQNQSRVIEFRVVLTLGGKGGVSGAERGFWGCR